MAKYQRKPETVEAVPFRIGMEDGFEVIPGLGQRPFMFFMEQKIPIEPNSLIVSYQNGDRFPVEHDEFMALYEPVEGE